MKKRIAMILVFALVLSTAFAAIVQAQTAAPTTTGGNKYPEMVVKSYVDGCTGNGAASQAYCQCTIDKIQAKYTLEQFMELAVKIEKGDMGEFMDVISECFSKL